ncbi:hypothetical protein WCLP8_130022 [uncultured Gammaproteobacteria bacterium]
MAILNDILDISKIEAEKLALETLDFDPALVVREVVDLLRGSAQAKEVSLGFEETTPLPALVRGDPTRFRQILFNLAGNAIKFTSAGRVTLRAKTIAQDWKHCRLQFEVEDTGIGISRAQRATLFEPFAQGDASTTRRFGGSGLGLAISKRLVEMMGGALAASSTPGLGSLFSFSVRLGLPSTPQIEVFPPTSVPPAPAIMAGKFRILLAEDNDINQLILRSYMEKRGHSVVVVANGVQAVAAVHAVEFDLVLMDMQMPEMDGEEATRRIRALPSPLGGLPIIALTADAILENRPRYLASGLTGFLTKPIDWHQFDQMLASIGRETSPLPAVALVTPAAGRETPLVDESQVEDLQAMISSGPWAETVALFTRNAVRAIAEMRAVDHPRKLAGPAHDLKGMAANFGAGRLAEVATTLTIGAHAGQIDTALMASLDALVEKTTAALLALEACGQGSNCSDLGQPPPKG